MKIGGKEERRGVLHSVTQDSNRLIVRHCGNAHPHMCDYFVREHNFSDLCRFKRDPGSKSKISHLKDIVFDFIYALRNLRKIRHAEEIITIGPMTLSIALLLRLGLLPSCRRVYWLGLFVHNPRWLPFIRLILKFLDSRRIQYIIFSDFEKELYTESLSLAEEKLFYIPYGDMSGEMTSHPCESKIEIGPDAGDFFFSGGYSNRDYPPLIEAFRTLPYKLVIICSPLNVEIDESLLPPNVKVFRDLPSEEFDAYLNASKACIIPIAHDTGAAGQSCLLRYMKSSKIIIATDTGIIREYITDGVSGILVKDNHEAMAAAIREVDSHLDRYRTYAETAHDRFVNFFSGEAIARRLDEMIGQITEGK